MASSDGGGGRAHTRSQRTGTRTGGSRWRGPGAPRWTSPSHGGRAARRGGSESCGGGGGGKSERQAGGRRLGGGGPGLSPGRARCSRRPLTAAVPAGAKWPLPCPRRLHHARERGIAAGSGPLAPDPRPSDAAHRAGGACRAPSRCPPGRHADPAAAPSSALLLPLLLCYSLSHGDCVARCERGRSRRRARPSLAPLPPSASLASALPRMPTRSLPPS